MPVARVLLAAVLAFVLPPAIFAVGDFILIHRAPGGPFGNHLFQVAVFVAPFASFAFLARPFGRWVDLDASARRLCVILAAAYWSIYTPLLLYWLLVTALSWTGGI